MANRLKCRKCGHVFKISEGDQLKCPACGSVEVAFHPGSFKKRRAVILMVSLLLMSAIVFIILRYFPSTDCLPPEISGVKVDSINHTITISAVASSPRCKLSYSIDNNKTGPYGSPAFSNVPAGQYYVCVIFGDGPDDRVLWEHNPVIMPATNVESTFPPPQVIGAEIIRPTNEDYGEIIVYARSFSPIEYVLNDSITQKDSIFKQLAPGQYAVSVIDSIGRIDRFTEILLMPEQPKKAEAKVVPCKNLDKGELQAQINNLFNGQRGNQELQNEILSEFASRKLIVKGNLLNTSETYTIYQYLYRQNIGLPGSIQVRITDLRYNQICKITEIEIEEYENL